jgi:hypothetical protein
MQPPQTLIPSVPPQSTPVSPPFCTESTHVGAWQTLPVQTPLVQSALPPQFLPSAHVSLAASQVVPPQSRSVSAPFFTPSVHVAAAQCFVASHTPLLQSPATRHFFVSAHPLHVVPPQSISVSAPFCSVSEHVGLWHVGPHVDVWGGSQSSCVAWTVPSPQNSEGNATIVHE